MKKKKKKNVAPNVPEEINIPTPIFVLFVFIVMLNVGGGWFSRFASSEILFYSIYTNNIFNIYFKKHFIVL